MPNIDVDRTCTPSSWKLSFLAAFYDEEADSEVQENNRKNVEKSQKQQQMHSSSKTRQEHAEIASSQMQSLYQSKTEQSTVRKESRSEEAREWQQVAQTRETRMAASSSSTSSSNVVVGSSNLSLQQFNVVSRTTDCLLYGVCISSTESCSNIGCWYTCVGWRGC